MREQKSGEESLQSTNNTLIKGCQEKKEHVIFLLLLFCLFVCFESRSHYVAQTDLEFTVKL